MAKTIDELPLYSRILGFSGAVIAILEKPQLRRSRRLWEQLSEANDSIVSNFAEGFEQGSDAGFARYLVHSKASVAEVLARLQQAGRRQWVSPEELSPLVAEAEEIGRMLGGFIKYLQRSDFTDRGSYKHRR